MTPQQEAYTSRARLLHDLNEIAQYQRILDNDNYRPEESHWNSLGKNTITLFQVLIDQDLRHLVMVLQHYPRFIPAVCEHFRYAYSYSGNEASIDAASELLSLSEPYFTKQFVRNVMRKLPDFSHCDREDLIQLAKDLGEKYTQWHPIIINHYLNTINQRIDALALHPLQVLAIKRFITGIDHIETFEYTASDRDATLDIPYMN